MRCWWGEYNQWKAVSVLSSIRKRPSLTYLETTRRIIYDSRAVGSKKREVDTRLEEWAAQESSLKLARPNPNVAVWISPAGPPPTVAFFLLINRDLQGHPAVFASLCVQSRRTPHHQENSKLRHAARKICPWFSQEGKKQNVLHFHSTLSLRALLKLTNRIKPYGCETDRHFSLSFT